MKLAKSYEHFFVTNIPITFLNNHIDTALCREIVQRNRNRMKIKKTHTRANKMYEGKQHEC